jgi:hypothetical protein
VVPSDDVTTAVDPFTWKDEARRGAKFVTDMELEFGRLPVFPAMNVPLVFDQMKATLLLAPVKPPTKPRSPVPLSAIVPERYPRPINESRIVKLEELTVVVVPWICRSPGMITFPVEDPIVVLVAAPPIFNVVAVVLTRLNVVAVVVISPPLTARSPATVRSFVVLLNVSPLSPPKVDPPSLNWTCVSEPPGVPPPPVEYADPAAL